MGCAYCKINICINCKTMRSLKVDSSNINIDDFIKNTQVSINSPHLEWVAHENFTNIKKIGQGGFSKIYKAYK